MTTKAVGSGYAIRFCWNYLTYPYDFAEQKWTTNMDIYDTYPSIDGKGGPKFTYHLINPKGIASYEDAIREGYIRSVDEIQSYEHWINGIDNNVLLMVDEDVLYRIIEKETGKNVLEEGSAYFLGGTEESRLIDGRRKKLINIQLKDGEYIIAFWINQLSDKNHYAMYTGEPLPIKKTHHVSGTHRGTVKWNGGGVKCEREKVCSPVRVSVAKKCDPALFALYRVSFEDSTSGGNLYVRDVTYYYTSPTASMYKILSKNNKIYYDNTPYACSAEGSYGTKFRVTWSPNVGYKYASFSSNTMMSIDYLVPYGLHAGM